MEAKAKVALLSGQSGKSLNSLSLLDGGFTFQLSITILAYCKPRIDRFSRLFVSLKRKKKGSGMARGAAGSEMTGTK